MASVQHRVRKDGSIAWRALYRHHGKQRTATFATEKAARQFVKMINDLGTDQALAVLKAREATPDATIPTLGNFGRDVITQREGHR